MEREANALARLEALVRVVEDEARARGTLHLFERWKATLPGGGPGQPGGERVPSSSGHRSRRGTDTG